MNSNSVVKLDRVPPYLYSDTVQMGEQVMANTTTYTRARAEFASLCAQVADTREPVIIRRRNAEDVALVSADELASLLETAHLLRSPRNANRLLTAINRAQRGQLPPSSVGDLREKLGLG